MKYYIRIQSISDIITNSSSEVYTVYTDTPVDVVREWFHSILRKWGYSQDDIDYDSTIGGCIYENDFGEVVISYSIMCNINEDIYSVLTATFGERNVKAEY